MKKNIELVKVLLTHPNIKIHDEIDYNYNAVNIAAKNKDLEILNILLDHFKIENDPKSI